MVDQVATDIETLLARLEIRELIDRYHAAINMHDWPLLEDTFDAGATWEALAPLNLRFDGRDAIVKGLMASVARQELLVQSSSGIVVNIHSGDSASIRSTLIEMGREADGGRGWAAVAFYLDNVRKSDGVWRFVRRSLHLRYEGDTSVGSKIVPVPGERR